MVLNFILVFFLGVVITLVVISRLSAGIIKIDRTNPDKDVYRLEIDDLDKLAKKKYILLRVNPKADLSQN